MRKNYLVVLLAVLLLSVLCASNVFAQTSTATVTGVDSNSRANADADQNQNQNQNLYDGDSVSYSGGSVSNLYYNAPKNLLALPGAGPTGNFVVVTPAQPNAPWLPELGCEKYSYSELEAIVGWSLFLSSGVRSVHFTKDREYNKEGELLVLGFAPKQRPLADYKLEGKADDLLMSAAGRLLLLAWRETNTRAVLVLVRVKGSDSTTAWSAGIGGGASGLPSNSTGIAGTLGFLYGKSRAFKEERFEVRVLAFGEDVVPPGADPCGKVLKTSSVPPPVPSVAKEEGCKDCGKKKPCNPSSIQKRIERLEKERRKCKRWCFNNLKIRSAMGDAYVDLYKCTGDRSALSSAAYHYDVAEQNFLKGYDIEANEEEADLFLRSVYKHWGAVINEFHGEGGADGFVNQRGLRKEDIPAGIDRNP